MFFESPLFGIGLGRYIEESQVGLSSHNWYVSVGAEMGVVGIVLWVLFIASIIIGLRNAQPSARTVGYSILAAWTAASLTLEVPAAYQVTGPTLIILASAVAARWPVSSDATQLPPRAIDTARLGYTARSRTMAGSATATRFSTLSEK